MKKRRAERQDKMRELMVFAVSILVVCILLAGQEFRKVREWDINEDEEIGDHSGTDRSQRKKKAVIGKG